jgi:hypothetical protein
MTKRATPAETGDRYPIGRPNQIFIHTRRPLRRFEFRPCRTHTIGSVLGWLPRPETPAPKLDRETNARRVILAAAAALIAGLIAYQLPRDIRQSDFAQVWAAARGWRHGMDPYEVVGPDRVFRWQFPLLYPLPAVIVGLPFSWLSLPWADACFVASGAAAFLWAVTRDGLRTPRLWGLASLPFCYAVATSQWSPLITASVLTPLLAPLWVCKPTIGASLLIAYPRRSTLVAGLLFLLVSVAVHPVWVRDWIAGLSTAPHVVAPLRQTFAGLFVLLALTRWRRPEARLLVALACLPQTPLLYEAVPLFLIPKKHWEGVALVMLSLVAWLVWQAETVSGYDAIMAASGRLMVWCLYLPATFFVLQRPNVWVDRSTGNDPRTGEPASVPLRFGR